MFCWDADSCNERYQDHQYWMSSTKWAPEMAQGGIFATDGSSAWGQANRIYIKCVPRAALRAGPLTRVATWLT
jgi:hypothetical protein